MLLLKSFENLIEGGFRENTIYLLKGVPASGKTSFALTLANELIAERGRKVVYATTELAPQEITAHACHGFNWNFEDFEKQGQLLFVDCYSWRLGKTHDGHVEDLTNLAELSNDLNKLITEYKTAAAAAQNEGKPFFFVFDTATSLFLYNDPSSVVKFMQVQVARLRNAGISAIILLEEGINEQRIVNTISFFVDGIFELRLTEVKGEPKRFFRVFSVKGARHKQEWFAFKITRNGFAFAEEISPGFNENYESNASHVKSSEPTARTTQATQATKNNADVEKTAAEETVAEKSQNKGLHLGLQILSTQSTFDNGCE